MIDCSRSGSEFRLLAISPVTAVPDNPKEGASGIGCEREHADFSVDALLHFNVTEHAVIEMSANVANHQVSTRF
jgi:hypothetical protein